MALVVAGALTGGLIVTQIPHHGVDELGPSGPSAEAWLALEHRELAEHLVVRGNVIQDQPLAIRSPASGVVTATYPIAFGTPVAELSGDPLFLLAGTFPGYRDLRPGLSGPDVEQLNAALNALGYGTAGDSYDSRTAGAVEALYAEHGHAAPQHTEPELVGIRQQLTAERNELKALQAQHDISAKARDRLAAKQDDPEAEDADALETELQTMLLEHEQLHDQIDLTKSTVGMLERQVEELSAQEGVMLPQRAAMFAASDRGLTLRLTVGDRVSQDDPVLVSQAGAAAAKLQLTPSQIELVSPLIPVQAILEIGDLTVDSTIGELSAEGLSEISLGGVQAVTGTPVRATVALDKSEGAVLAIPVTALTKSGDEWTVVVRRGTGSAVIPVQVGRDIGGWTELVEGDLKAGDEVRVG